MDDTSARAIERGRFLYPAGLRTHVLDSGKRGTPALLLHGLGSLAQEILTPLRLHAPGRTFVAPDRPGYGFSEPLAINMGPIVSQFKLCCCHNTQRMGERQQAEPPVRPPQGNAARPGVGGAALSTTADCRDQAASWIGAISPER